MVGPKSLKGSSFLSTYTLVLSICMDLLLIVMCSGDPLETEAFACYSKLWDGLTATIVGLAPPNYVLSSVALGKVDMYDTIAYLVLLFTFS